VRTIELLQSKKVQAYKGLSTKSKKAEETQDSPSFDPDAIVTTGIGEGKSKGQQTPNKRRGSTHILLDQWGLRTKEE
jgi:hypothetical protein